MADGGVITLNQAHGDGVFQFLLDGAAQVAGTVNGGVGLLDQIVHQRVLPGEGNVLFTDGGGKLLEHEGGNVPEILLGKLVEGDDFIHTVDKLGSQELLQGLDDPIPVLLIGGAAGSVGFCKA